MGRANVDLFFRWRVVADRCFWRCFHRLVQLISIHVFDRYRRSSLSQLCSLYFILPRTSQGLAIAAVQGLFSFVLLLAIATWRHALFQFWAHLSDVWTCRMVVLRGQTRIWADR